jgi:Conserved TM helix
VVGGSVNNWTDSVSSGVSESLGKVFSLVPDVLASMVVLLIGVVVASVLKAVVVRLLRAIKLKGLTDRLGLDRVFTGKFDIAGFVGDLVKWFFIIVFLLQALTIAHLEDVNNVISRLLGYVPNVIVAAVLVLVGFVVADLTSRLVLSGAVAIGANTSKFLASIARYSILSIVAFTTLAQLGVNTLFLDRLFTAIVAMLALAGGLAFGIGGQDSAKEFIKSASSSLRKNLGSENNE